MSNSLENAAQKIYEKISETGEITENQMALIILYEKKNRKPKKDGLQQIISYANKIAKIINNNLKE